MLWILKTFSWRVFMVFHFIIMRYGFGTLMGQVWVPFGTNLSGVLKTHIGFGVGLIVQPTNPAYFKRILHFYPLSIFTSLLKALYQKPWTFSLFLIYIYEWFVMVRLHCPNILTALTSLPRTLTEWIQISIYCTEFILGFWYLHFWNLKISVISVIID